jgi:predicted ATPase
MISRIEVNNFKAFKNAELNLTNLNIFTGMNGMGKSTFIQSLLLLRQSYSPSGQIAKGLRLKGELIDIGKGKDAHSIHASSDQINFQVDYDDIKLIDESFKFNAENDVLSIVHNNNLVDNLDLIKYSLFNNSFKYLKAERSSPEHNYKANVSAVTQDRFIGYKGENAPLYIALYKLEQLSISSVKHKNAVADNFISHLDAWFNDITPGTHIISTYLNEFDIVKLGYQFDYGKDWTPLFSPLNVGFGFTYTLPVLTMILTAKEGDLIIIENPESHLHPQGQAKLGELIARAANDGVQIIIETHSDHLLNGIRVAVKNKLVNVDDVSVMYFSRDMNQNEHITIIDQPIIESTGKLNYKPVGFFDEYSKQLDYLIKKNL